jgi:uncharacterized membrane protein
VTETATKTSGGMNENTMALIAYVLTWITGLIVLLTSPKTAKYQRWHAIQAIGLGIVWSVVGIVGNVLGVGFFAFGMGGAGPGMVIGLVFGLLSLGFLVLWIVMMVTSYQGKKIRLPIIAGIADKNA